MKNTYLIVCIILFLVTTVFGYMIDVSGNVTKSQFSNSSITMNNSSNELKNKDIDMYSNKTDFDNHNINIDNNSNISSDSYENQSTYKINPNDIDFNNIDDSYSDKKQSIYYNNIDWSTWKSNFVNRILDDSIDQIYLDTYNEGSWIYYSFDVYKSGFISNIKVVSMSLSKSDKQRFRNFLKNYSYDPITRFPNDTKRSVTTVSAVILLSDQTVHSDSKDFPDIEHIKDIR